MADKKEHQTEKQLREPWWVTEEKRIRGELSNTSKTNWTPWIVGCSVVFTALCIAGSIILYFYG